ncbi:MAG: radical SAM family heme chaperone HemW [Clostridia bacterium]|nr:radical SAM family heme chaperone HemW [Clostridia bacterium]
MSLSFRPDPSASCGLPGHTPAAADHSPARAAYVHWPFCQQKCAYCDFISWPGRSRNDMGTYVELLKREIEAVGTWSRLHGLTVPLASVFFGGGTPSLADPADLAAILELLRAQFGLEPDAEITLEANPGTLRPGQLDVLRAAGFNRISFGLQATQDSLLQTLGRIHSYADFLTSVRDARAAGFDRISADLMLGLPGQTLADALESVERVLALGIDHVSYYSLIIEPGTPFAERYLDRPDLLPDEDLERTIYHAVRNRLADAGLLSYEISNAARPGQECRHNLVYWRGELYYGFGVAAHSYLAGIRRGNTDDWRTYSSVWGEAGGTQSRPGVREGAQWPFLALESFEVIDPAEARKECFLLGLRLTQGVAWADYQTRFGVDDDARKRFAAEFHRLLDRGLIEIDDLGVRLTPLGLDLANQAFSEFV